MFTRFLLFKHSKYSWKTTIRLLNQRHLSEANHYSWKSWLNNPTVLNESNDWHAWPIKPTGPNVLPLLITLTAGAEKADKRVNPSLSRRFTSEPVSSNKTYDESDNLTWQLSRGSSGIKTTTWFSLLRSLFMSYFGKQNVSGWLSSSTTNLVIVDLTETFEKTSLISYTLNFALPIDWRNYYYSVYIYWNRFLVDYRYTLFYNRTRKQKQTKKQNSWLDRFNR